MLFCLNSQGPEYCPVSLLLPVLLNYVCVNKQLNVSVHVHVSA